MKNVSIFGVHGKIRVLGEGGGGHEKPIYRGLLKKLGEGGRALTICRFKGGGS